jgi:dTDP-4-dehydrorhamnose 3,5-epimerase
MKLISITPLKIPDVQVVRFGRFRDDRGFFTEPYRLSDLKGHLNGFEGDFVQSNESFSHKNVIRGLHFQWNPYMGKLVRTLSGRMVDLFLDIRKGSPTYGKAMAYAMPADLSVDYAEWIWIPPGFAHGNFFTEESSIVYFCSGEYSQGCEAGICPFANDIDWSLCDRALKQEFDSLSKNAVVSDKDRNGLTVKQWSDDPRSDNFVYDQLNKAASK